MADAPEGPVWQEWDPDWVPDSSRKVISVLLLATRWTFDTYGLSTVNKSIVNNLRLIDPDAKTIKITCAVLEEEGKISEDQCKMLITARYNSLDTSTPEGLENHRPWNG